MDFELVSKICYLSVFIYLFIILFYFIFNKMYSLIVYNWITFTWMKFFFICIWERRETGRWVKEPAIIPIRIRNKNEK